MVRARREPLLSAGYVNAELVLRVCQRNSLQDRVKFSVRGIAECQFALLPSTRVPSQIMACLHLGFASFGEACHRSFVSSTTKRTQRVQYSSCLFALATNKICWILPFIQRELHERTIQRVEAEFVGQIDQVDLNVTDFFS